MNFAALHKLITYLVSGLGLVALALGNLLGTFQLISMLVAFVVSWFVEGERLHDAHYQRAWTGLLVLMLLLQVLRWTMAAPPLTLAVEFAVILSLSRLFNRRSAAEHHQLALLAFLHLIAATAITTDIRYGLLFVAFLVTSPWMLTLSHLRADVEQQYMRPAQESAAAARVRIGRVVASPRLVRPRLLLWLTTLSLPLFISTASLFMLMPRVGLGYIQWGEARASPVIGFADQIELGHFGVLKPDPSVFLRLRPARPLDAKERTTVKRVRGTAFDHYDGRRWSRSMRTRRVLPEQGGRVWLRPESEAGDLLELEVMLEYLDPPVVFVPSGTVWVELPERGPPGLRRSLPLSHAPGLDLRYAPLDAPAMVYRVGVQLSAGTAWPVEPGVPVSSYLQLPPGHERVVALAERLTAGEEGPVARLRRLLQHLRAEGRYQYSLDLPPVADDQVPLEVFLFEARRGHCEYFSSAMTLMLRAVGVPARNVTGFLGGQENAYGGYLAMRQSDAHSWVEALLPGRGWVTVDPTPSRRAGAGPSAVIGGPVQQLLDAARAWWLRRVIEYNLDTQVTGLRGLGHWFSSLRSQQGQANTEEVVEFREALRAVAPWLVGALAVGVLLWLRARHRAAVRQARQPELRLALRRVRRLHRRMERLLERRGHGRPPQRTLAAHARALRMQGVGGAEQVARVTELFEHVRYGGAGLSPAVAQEMDTLIKGLRRQLPRASKRGA